MNEFNPQEAPTIPPVIDTHGEPLGRAFQTAEPKPPPVEERIAIALEHCASALVRIAQHCDTGATMRDENGQVRAMSIGNVLAAVVQLLSQLQQQQAGPRIMVPPGRRPY